MEVRVYDKSIKKTDLNRINKTWETWSNDQLIDWFASLDLKFDYSKCVKISSLTGKDIPRLTPDYLEKIKIKNADDKVKICNAMSHLVNNNLPNTELYNVKHYKNDTADDKYVRFQNNQIMILEKIFETEPNCPPEIISVLSKEFNCPFNKILKWFNNKRYKVRKQQKEDCFSFNCSQESVLAFTSGQNNKAPTMKCEKCNFPNHVASSTCSLCSNPFPKLFKSIKVPLKQALDIESNLKRDLDNDKSNCLRCNICNKTFKKFSIVKRHMRVHTGEKPYPCAFCDKSFSHNQDKKRHEMTHTGIKPFVCDICGKSYIRKSGLDNHLTSHDQNSLDSVILSANKKQTDGKEVNHFDCSYCEKTFDRVQNLLHHERVHTGEKPYQCNHCLKRFTQEHHVKRHLNTHQPVREFRCAVISCMALFPCNKRLSQHMKEVHKNLICRICNTPFKRPSAFNRHLNVH